MGEGLQRSQVVDGAGTNGVVVGLDVVGSVYKYFEGVGRKGRQVGFWGQGVEGRISQVQGFVDGIPENDRGVRALTQHKSYRNAQNGRKTVVSNVDPHRFLVGVRTETILGALESQYFHFHGIGLVDFDVVDADISQVLGGSSGFGCPEAQTNVAVVERIEVHHRFFPSGCSGTLLLSGQGKDV